MKVFRKIQKAFKIGTPFFKYFLEYFRQASRSKLMKPYLRALFKSLEFHIDRCRQSLNYKVLFIKHLEDQRIKKLQQVTQGLHQLLPSSPLLSYSILIVADDPNPTFFKRALESALNQTAPHFEVLVKYKMHPAIELQQVIGELKKQFPGKLKDVFTNNESKSVSTLYNDLAKQAQFHYLILMGQEDWLRPDFLFRYEQTLRALPQPDKSIVYCDCKLLSVNDFTIPLSEIKRHLPLFPYIFERFPLEGFLIPKKLWTSLGGMRPDFEGAEGEDLILRLNLTGALFQPIPLYLYYQRDSAYEKNKSRFAREAFLTALADYTKTKNLSWKWVPGYGSQDSRAIPAIEKEHTVQVIIPFKDQKELTLSCVQHILKQKDVKIKITALDNNSTDDSISQELSRLGVEVISVLEPFNFSRLNNLAVRLTKTAQDCDVLLFLNNDVDLEEEALLEMLRWIDQPQIGMVGCRLHYPDGRLQHGGVHVDYYYKPLDFVEWEHIEKLRTFDQMKVTKTLGITPAVTAACALMKRKTFLEIGGFDEIWYPIGYSDTNLAVKLNQIGLKCFYTPFAIGKHHESVSRQASIEDFENSRWLQELLIQNNKLLTEFPTK